MSIRKMLILFVQTRKPRGAHISWGRNQEITFGHGGSALSLIEPTDWFVGLKIHFWMSSALHGLLCHGAWGEHLQRRDRVEKKVKVRFWGGSVGMLLGKEWCIKEKEVRVVWGDPRRCSEKREVKRLEGFTTQKSFWDVLKCKDGICQSIRFCNW